MEQKKLKILALTQDLIHENKNEYKEFDSYIYHKLLTSVAIYGQVQLIVVKPKGDKYEIINGHKLYAAMKQLGYKEFISSVVTDDYDVLDIILNELHFKTNYIELSERLLGKDIDEIKRYLPFTENEIEKIKTIMSFDWGKLIKKKDESQVSLFDLEQEEVVENEPTINMLTQVNEQQNEDFIDENPNHELNEIENTIQNDEKNEDLNEKDEEQNLNFGSYNIDLFTDI